jgi:alpha-beta hydrolase superfamily lysophospholipase
MEKDLPLQPGAHSFFLAHNSPPPKGTVLLFHGFCSGAWQFKDIGEQLYDRGFNAYALRLPGHGLLDSSGQPDSTSLPRPKDYLRYQELAEKGYQQARALGVPIRILGQSGGGAIAANLARNHPDIKQALFFAPFLGIGRSDARLLFKAVERLDKVFGGHPGRALNLIKVDTYEGVDPSTFGAGEVSRHRFATLGNVYALHRFARDQARNAGEIQVPVQILSSVLDDTIGLYGLRELYQGANSNTPAAWLHFNQSDAIPHAMAHVRDVQDEQKVKTVTDIAMNFFETSETRHAPPSS